ncbi:MAG: FeoB-associated Cys-rich membrane protein [Cyclobacteriaceae bacterium]|jgi:bacterioferritin-associated ferredoxin|nr:FeoB-associated Cys-rich membrane protein [Cyclobacteriaceae bacterium]
MVQQILVILIFLAAVAYLVTLIVRQFRAKSGCASGCGKCGALDLKEIEARINAAQKE